MTQQYNFSNIRALLTKGFTNEELRRLCFDNFRPVHEQLNQITGKATIVDLLMEHADKTMQFELILKWANEQNPTRFKAHQPYCEVIPSGSAPHESPPEESHPKKSDEEIKNSPKPHPSWILSSRQPQPIFHSKSEINAALKGYAPFTKPNAENELDFLFGSIGYFWSQHPTYATIAATFYPQVVLAPTGTGKTAFAYALTQIGNPEGNQLENSFLVLLKDNPRTFKDVQSQFAQALLHFINVNPALLAGFTPSEQRFLLRWLGHGVGFDLVQVRLAPLAQTNKTLTAIIEQAGHSAKPNQTLWLSQARQCLNLLGFERAMQVFDANSLNAAGLKFWLQNIPHWAAHNLIIKLFLSDSLSYQLGEAPDHFELLSLSWRDDQIAQMVQWRFESLARLTGIRTTIESLFDEGLYTQFLTQARGNPGRLARLWRYLFEDHLNFSPARSTFTSDNLARAVEKLK